MNEGIEFSGNFDTPDPDVFLQRVFDEAASQDAEYVELEAETVLSESRVLDIWERHGIDVTVIRALQTEVYPDAPLSWIVVSLQEILKRVRARDIDSDLKAVVLDKLSSNIWLAGQVSMISVNRGLVDLGKPGTEAKAEEQGRIINNDKMEPEEKTRWLAAIDELFSGYEGLDLTQPESLALVDAQRLDEEKKNAYYDIKQKMRPKVNGLIQEYLQANDIGDHDDLSELLDWLRATMLNHYGRVTAGLDHETIDASLRVREMDIAFVTSGLASLGWQQNQIRGLVTFIEEGLHEEG